MSSNIILGVTGIALMGVAAFGAYINYRWMERLIEREVRK